MSHVLVISPESMPIGENLSGGPGIRYWEMAHSLARLGHKVTVAVPADEYTGIYTGEIELISWTIENLPEICLPEDAVILPYVNEYLSIVYAHLIDKDIPTVVDLYDPVLIENLNIRKKSPESTQSYLDYLKGIRKLLIRGDFFLYANERQYYYYLGMLNAVGRINPYTYHGKILALVPFGIPGDSPRHDKNVLRGTVVGIKDPVLLWFSGIYPWFDAITLINAMPAVLEAVPDTKLVVMGGVHPDLSAPDDEYQKTLKAAKNLGLMNKSIFFTRWQPYNERSNYYLEADIAICTSKGQLENELSHRTRVIDLLWGGLPVITSEGDEVGKIAKDTGCGITVPVGDRHALAREIINLLRDKKKRTTMGKKGRAMVANRYTWDRVVTPLHDFLVAPTTAPDRRNRRVRAALDSDLGDFQISQNPRLDQELAKLTLPKKTAMSYRVEGLGGMLARTAHYFGRRIGWYK